jgi:hypothetical protein
MITNILKKIPNLLELSPAMLSPTVLLHLNFRLFFGIASCLDRKGPGTNTPDASGAINEVGERLEERV